MLERDRKRITQDLGYDPTSEAEILARASKLVHHTIQQVIDLSPYPYAPHAKLNKGAVGQIIERHWFGLEQNNSAAPDFDEPGIELKMIPIVEVSRGKYAVKERTKVCSINYKELANEIWLRSHAKTKLNKVLFIYVLVNTEPTRLLASKVIHYELWVLDASAELPIIQADWHTVQGYVADGRAHELSESLGRILAASRTGEGGGRDLVEYLEDAPKALKRAFSLKQSFTRQRWMELSRKVTYESVRDIDPRAKNAFELQGIILQKIAPLVGSRMDEIARRYGIPINGGKNAIPTLIKKLLGFKNVNSRVKEFDQFGLEIRVVPVRKGDHRPLEATSFPAFKLKELEEEEWEESMLQQYLDYILFVPIYAEHTKQPKGSRQLGRPFFWSPSNAEWAVIEREWSMYRDQVRRGAAIVSKVKYGTGYREVTGLSRESDTEIIHVRPHAKDRNDRDEDSHENKPVKQSFWLNKNYLQRLIINSNARKN